MRKTVAATLLVMMAPWPALAADYPVKFGEIRNGAVTPTNTIKKCDSKTGYAFGFEIVLPPQRTHEVAGDLYWPAPPGRGEKDAGVSSRHAMDSYGAHSGRYVKSLSLESDDLVGSYTLVVIVDHQPVTSIEYTVVPATICP